MSSDPISTDALGAKPPSNDGERYRLLRRVVGFLGMALPAVVVAWGWFLCGTLERSISDYYYLRTRDAFVGILFTVGWFFFTYSPYGAKDRWAGKIAWVAALGVALSPDQGTAAEQWIHYHSAALLFLDLAIMSLFLFTQSAGSPTPEKKRRNHVYRACGIVIAACIVTIWIYRSWIETPASTSRIVLYLEWAALWAFGISWLTKGEVVFPDKKPAAAQ